jgi:hypothetical protein
MIKVLGQYSDGMQAATHALDLVVKFLQMSNEQKEEITNLYAPFSSKTRTSKGCAPALATFDIDDTLLYDLGDARAPNDFSVKPNASIVLLLKRLYELGIEIHLITARLDCKEMIDASKEEMKELGIKYHSLTLAPAYARKSMASVSQWKMMTRKSIARKDECNPIVLTVGDQWGDMVVLDSDDRIDMLNEEHDLDHEYAKQYLVMRPNDKVSLWGLKLPAK